MNTIINAIPEYVITAVISTVFYFAIKQSQALIHSKVLHAKTEQSKAMWGLLEQIADSAVTSLVNADLTGDQKFNQATKIVQQTLSNQGFKNVDVKAIESAVQSAYEKSPLTPTAKPEEKVETAQLPNPMDLQAIQTKPGVDLASQTAMPTMKPTTPQLDQRVAGKGIPVEAAQQANKAGDTNGTN